jgi:uncharacterized repeat protein (TIGR03803 family)
MHNSSWARQASYLLLSCAMAPVVLLSQTLTTLHSFDGSDGAQVFASLIQAKNGNFYGTTHIGGAHVRGTVFEITPEGALSTLHSFDDADGSSPEAALVLGSDGDFYGTTSLGGTHLNGTMFKITPGGNLTTLHSFSRNKDGAQLVAPLIKGKDGDFYGTTSQGGPHDGGTVFKITPSGALTTLYAFCAQQSSDVCLDGEYPLGGLVQGANGSFYGTTESGGVNDAGAIFEITTGGKLTVLHSFAGTGADTDGRQPSAGLVLASNGNFYGTTPAGGANNIGTVFEMTPGGVLTTLHNFDGADGASPTGNLIEGANRNLYGVTTIGGANGTGTIFEVTLNGKLTSLYSFNSHHGQGDEPLAGLIQGINGDLYGTTTVHGQFSDGTVFQFSLDE